MVPAQQLSRLGAGFYRKTLQPRSANEDTRRRELILNSMLAGLAAVAVITLIVSMIYRFIIGNLQAETSLPTTTIFVAVVLGLWYLSRRGWYRIGVYALLILIWLGALNLAMGSSIELPGAELTFALGIVVAGVLVSGRTGVIVAAATSVVVIVIGNLQATYILHPDISWLHERVRTGDAVGYAAIFMVIGLVAWLANREIDRSLQRVRLSETALKHERDTLEVRVIERTHQLEQTQLQRMLEMQRFAEFGRFSAGFLHDLANPLTAASLNLQQLGEKPHTQVLQEMTRSLGYLERYIEAARKQLQNESELRRFALKTELEQVLAILALKAQRANVPVKLLCSRRLRLFGDPVKFSQLAANLIANAIEAYAGIETPRSKRGVTVTVARRASAIELTIYDFGIGVTPTGISEMFSPFYSTKQASGRNTGIGLAMVKQIAEKDFNGSITVTSSPTDGTKFVARLHHGIKAN